jgi:hypothetical protein
MQPSPEPGRWHMRVLSLAIYQMLALSDSVQLCVTRGPIRPLQLCWFPTAFHDIVVTGVAFQSIVVTDIGSQSITS